MKHLEFLTATLEIVRRVPPSRVEQFRAQLKKPLKDKVRELGIQELRKSGYSEKLSSDLIAYCEIHHILPLSFGGKTDLENLAMVEGYLHKALHRYMDRQALEFDGGENVLMVPRHPTGDRVWADSFKKKFKCLPIKILAC